MGHCAQEGYDQDISEHPLWLQREKCISGATAGSGSPVWRLEQGVRRVDREARGGGRGKEGDAPRGCVTVKNGRAGCLDAGAGAARRQDSVNVE